MGKWIHRLTDIDQKNKVANCSHCGLVGVSIKNKRKNGKIVGKRFRCLNAKAANARKVSVKTILEKPERCCLCNKKKKLVLDHKHGDKHMRGWICNQCNTVIGLVDENERTLKNIIKYLVGGFA